MRISEIAMAMKAVAPALASSDNETRCRALCKIREALLAHKDEIFACNAADLEAAKTDGVSIQVQKRLRFDEGKLASVCEGIQQLTQLPDPLAAVTLHRELDTGLVLSRVSVPIGVIGVIFEARPDALVQISSLCIRSGNCCILKGGKETRQTNRILSSVIIEALQEAGLPSPILYQAEERSEVNELLSCDTSIDLLIPRGSNAFVRYIMDNTRIPVMGHADGVCHIYIDSAWDMDLIRRILIDAKTQYPVACNSVETVLVRRDLADTLLPALQKTFADAGIEVRGTQETAGYLPCDLITEEDYHTEYGALILSVILVKDVAEAAAHINRYGSHHTDCILTDDDDHAAYFLKMVDSAGVYRNCSTRFADGFRYGFGAEVGISTSKLHARGPVGLDGLVTYKYLLEGEGQIVGDYASGRSAFHFRDLQ